MYKSSQPQVAFGQSAAPGSSDNEWTCATAFIQGICPGLEWEFQLEPVLVAWGRRPQQRDRKRTSAESRAHS